MGIFGTQSLKITFLLDNNKKTKTNKQQKKKIPQHKAAVYIIRKTPQW